MKTVIEYRQFAAECRELAAKLAQAKDKQALELMAKAWDKVADGRVTALRQAKKKQRRPIQQV
jgi:hypothetical protein